MEVIGEWTRIGQICATTANDEPREQGELALNQLTELCSAGILWIRSQYFRFYTQVKNSESLSNI